MPTSDDRLVKLLQKKQQELQEQLEESQRELAKAQAEAEAAKSAASQQQEPAATAQNMTSTIQTGKKSTTTTKVYSDDDENEDEDSQGKQGKLPDSLPVPRIKYIHEVYNKNAKLQDTHLMYVVEFNFNGSFKKVHSILERKVFDEQGNLTHTWNVCTLERINDPHTVCPIPILLMILSDSTEVHRKYDNVIQEIFPEGITSDNAEAIFNFCTADDEEKPVEKYQGELKPTRQQAPYHSGYDVPPPSQPASEAQHATCRIMTIALHEFAKLMMQYENLNQLKKKANEVEASHRAREERSDSKYAKVLSEISKVNLEAVKKSISEYLSASKVEVSELPPDKLISIEIEGLLKTFTDKIKDAGNASLLPKFQSVAIELLSPGAILAIMGEPTFEKIYGQRMAVSTSHEKPPPDAPSAKTSSRRAEQRKKFPGQDTMKLTKSEHIPMTSLQTLTQTAKNAGNNPCVSPYGDSRIPQAEVLRDLEADLDRPDLSGSQRNLTRSMAWTYMLEPMVLRANDLNVKHVNSLYHDAMMVMDAIEEKASKLLVEYAKKRIIEKIKNRDAKEVLQDKITTLLTKDENRRAMNTSDEGAILPCVVLDPYMLMLRMMSRGTNPNIGKFSYTVNVLSGALSFWHPASHANHGIVLQALCNVVDYQKTGAPTLAVYLSTANNSTSTLWTTAQSLWDCPNPVLNPQNEKIFDCLVLSLTLTSIFGIESLDINLSDEHKRLLKRLRDDHQEKVKAYQKEHKDDDPSMVLQRLYKDAGNYLDKNRSILERISTVSKGEGERKKANGAFAGSAAGTHTADFLQAKIQSRSSTLTGTSSKSKESKRRAGKSGSQQAAKHTPPSSGESDAMVKLVKKSDQLLDHIVKVVYIWTGSSSAR